MKVVSRVLPMVLVALLVLAGGSFFVLFERVAEEQDAELAGEAGRNPYFTAQQLLDRLGMATLSRYGLGELPPTNHVVVILTPNNAQRIPLVPRLFGWVSGGGHLVVVPTEEPAEWEALLGLLEGDDQDGEDTGERAGADLPGSDHAGPSAPDTAQSAAAGGTDTQHPEDDLLAAFGIELTDRFEGEDALPVQVRAPGHERVRRLRLHQAPLGVQWTDIDERTEPSDLQVWPARGRRLDRTIYAVAEREVGQGRVSVVADRKIFENRALFEADHALFLTDLVTGRGAPAGVLFVLSGDSPSIPGLVWRTAWPAVVALVVGLLAWARRASQRFGPLLAGRADQRRSLMEHIDATGQFLWRHEAGSTLLQSARRRLRRRLLRRHPELAEVRGQDFVTAVATRLGVLPEIAQTALISSPPTGDVRRFLVALRAVQTLWSHS